MQAVGPNILPWVEMLVRLCMAEKILPPSAEWWREERQRHCAKYSRHCATLVEKLDAPSGMGFWARALKWNAQRSTLSLAHPSLLAGVGSRVFVGPGPLALKAAYRCTSWEMLGLRDVSSLESWGSVG